MKTLPGLRIVALALAAALSSARAQDLRPLYLDPTQPLEKRVEDLLPRLTLEEKISLLHGDSKFTTAAIPRLGLPRRWLSDGPHGVREDIGPDTWRPSGRTDDFATAMPSGIALAATWNPDLARATGGVIGEEARARGKHIMLGPAVNIMRSPLCGRNFEYMGEDPFLSARMAVGYIQGEQEQGVASCVKHFAANNQETQRNSINVIMDERALREIYLPAFEAAVKEAGVWTIMGAYNKFRGEYCCQNDYLLNQVLKGEWGFKGIVISDWNGTHDTKEAALHGLDLEMGTERKAYDEYFLAHPFLEGVQRGEYPLALLDDKVRRNLRVMIGTGVLDGRAPAGLNTPQHQAVARKVAGEAMVLLKNENATLPLQAGKIRSIAVIGENATRLQTHGGQSSEIKAFYEITPLAGILHRAGPEVNVTYSVGYGNHVSENALARAVDAAKAADVAVVVGGLNHDLGFDCESRDKKDLKLPYGQDELIRRVVEANPKTIVVLIAGSPVEMSGWIDKVPAALLAWYPGMEGGNALADILFGDVNPSGKLPCTFPKQLADSPAHVMGNFPGSNGTVRYEEGLLVGYRWYDTKQVAPLFPFGHGLSFTKFDYSGLKLVHGTDPAGAVITAEFEIMNSGSVQGTEVVQLYVHDAQSSLARPVQELKGFSKIALKPGEKKSVSIPLDIRAFSFYDPAARAWRAEPGTFTVMVGSSSRDLRLKENFNLTPRG